MDNRLEETPVLGGPVVLVRSVDGKLSALAKSSGQIRWSKTGITQVATVNEETVWVADTAGNIRLLDLETGEEKAPATGGD